jgi:S-DNA-T family DNA segregation ATPase FtsK/SpoIIIE
MKDRESELIGDIIIICLKPVLSYIRLCFKGLKKVHQTKLTGRYNKAVFCGWMVLIITSIYNLFFNANPKEWLVYACSFIIICPCLNILKLYPKVDKNEWFYSLYDKLGFKKDFEENLNYPTFIEMEYKDNLVIYKFFSNNNKLDNFRKNSDLIEEYLTSLFDKYHDIIEIKRNDNKRIIEIIATNKRLVEFYKWGAKLVPGQGKIFIGESITGGIIAKWNNFHHILIAGEVGGGKTVAVKNIIMQLLHQSISGNPLIIKIADFKGAVDYNFLSSTFEVITDKKRLMKFTETLIIEMNRRIELIKSIGVENVDTYNKKVDESEQIPRIVLVIDELVECLDKEGLDKKDKKDSEEIKVIDTISRNLTKLARLSRCININMILGTQLPTSACLGNQLKNNIPARLCGRFADESASRVVLSSTMAKNLPDIKGRMMYKMGANITELQAPFLNNDFMKYYISQNKDKVQLDEIQENADIKKEKTISLKDLKNMKINLKKG